MDVVADALHKWKSIESNGKHGFNAFFVCADKEKGDK